VARARKPVKNRSVNTSEACVGNKSSKTTHTGKTIKLISSYCSSKHRVIAVGLSGSMGRGTETVDINFKVD
jgi:hypothetical protein